MKKKIILGVVAFLIVTFVLYFGIFSGKEMAEAAKWGGSAFCGAIAGLFVFVYVNND